MPSIQRAWRVFAVALDLDFLFLIGVGTVVAAILLERGDFT
jgi:hypothetical protein